MKNLKLSVFFWFQKNHKPQNIEDISNNASQTFESFLLSHGCETTEESESQATG